MTTIKPTTLNPDELAAMAEVQRAAFAGTPIEELIFGKVTDDDYRAGVVKRIKRSVEDPKQAMWTAWRDGKVVGSALWGLPKGPNEPEKKEKETEEERLKKVQARFPPGADWVLGDQFFSSIDLKIEEPHLHLSVLVVDPAAQRTGAGSALLRWGNSFADKHGVDIYLEASVVGVPVYEKHGYKSFRSPIYGGPNNEMVLYPMRRPALAIKPATSSQLAKIAELHRTAFAPTLWFSSHWGKVKPECFDEWYIKIAKQWMEEDHLVVALRDDEVLGIAHWEEKEGPTTVNEDEPSMPEGTNMPVAVAYSRDLAKYTSSIEGKYWHLHILAAHPPRTGAGRALVQWGASRAQKEGLPVYLERGEEALKFYDSLGFKQCAPRISTIDGATADTPLVLHPLIVASAVAEDLPTLSALHREAFWPSAHKRAMFTNVSHEAYEAWNLKRIQKWNRPDLADRHWIAVAKRGDVILGFGHIELCGGPAAEKVEADFDSLPEGSDVEMATELVSLLEAVEKKIPAGRYMMLQQLATSPRYQKTGAGKALMDWLIEKSQSLGLDLYLDSTVEGRRLYDSVGCEQWAPTVWFEQIGAETFPMVKRCSRPDSSASAPLTLSPATPNDIPALARLFHAAFEPLEIFRYMFDDCPQEPSTYDAWNEQRMQRWISDEQAHAGTEKQRHWTMVARRGDTLLAFGHWELHGVAKAEGQEELPAIPLPEGTKKDRAKKVFDKLQEVADKVKGESYMLHQLACDPRYQRTGAGRALIGWGVELAESKGHSFVLDAVPPARTWYHKLGFEEWDEPTSAGEGFPVTYPMIYKGSQK